MKQKKLLVLLFLIFLGCTETLDNKIKNAGYFPDETGFFHAVKSEDEVAVKLFIQKGIPVNSLDKNGASTLLYAATQKTSSMLNLLLKSGAEILLTDNSKKSSLHYAAENCSFDNTIKLLEKGANPKWKDNYSRTALLSHLAKTEKECPKVFEALINSEININERDKDRKTALIYSSEKNFPKYLNKLIELKASPLTKDYRGKTALDYALENFEEQKTTEEFVEKIRNYTVEVKQNL